MQQQQTVKDFCKRNVTNNCLFALAHFERDMKVLLSRIPMSIKGEAGHTRSSFYGEILNTKELLQMILWS